MTQGMDPVLVNLLGNARSEAVRREFLSTPPEEYTQLHDVTVLVSHVSSQGSPLQGSSAPSKTPCCCTLMAPVASAPSCYSSKALQLRRTQQHQVVYGAAQNDSQVRAAVPGVD